MSSASSGARQSHRATDQTAPPSSDRSHLVCKFFLCVSASAPVPCPVSRARELCCKILSVPLVVPVSDLRGSYLCGLCRLACTCVELFLCMFLCSKKERKLTQMRDRRTTRRHRTGISREGSTKVRLLPSTMAMPSTLLMDAANKTSEFLHFLHRTRRAHATCSRAFTLYS